MSNTINFNELGLTAKNSTKVKEYAKQKLDSFILEKVREYFGEENVSEVFKDGREMNGRAISVGMGIVQDEGFNIEVCVNIELTAKAITETTRKTTTGRLSTTEIDDRLTEAEIYKQEKERKEKEKADKKKNTDKKKEKDNARRERAKELADAQKKAKEKQDAKTQQDIEKIKNNQEETNQEETNQEETNQEETKGD